MTSQGKPDLNPVEDRLRHVGRIFLLTFLALAAVTTAFMAPNWRWFGFWSVGVCLLGLVFLHFRMSQRSVGWTAVALGLIGSGIAEFLSPSTLAGLLAPLSSHYDQAVRAAIAGTYFQDAAAMLFALGLPLALLNRAETHFEAWLEIAAGIVGLLAAVAFAISLVIWPSAVQLGFLTFAVATVMGGAVDITARKWKNAIAAAAVLLAVEMFVAFFHPAWLDWVRDAVVAAWRTAADNTYADTLWAMIFGGGATALACANARLSWRRALVATGLVVTNIWIVLVTVSVTAGH